MDSLLLIEGDMASHLELLLTLIRVTYKHENEGKLGHATFGTTRVSTKTLILLLSLPPLVLLAASFWVTKRREIKHSHSLTLGDDT